MYILSNDDIGNFNLTNNNEVIHLKLYTCFEIIIEGPFPKRINLAWIFIELYSFVNWANSWSKFCVQYQSPQPFKLHIWLWGYNCRRSLSNSILSLFTLKVLVFILEILIHWSCSWKPSPFFQSIILKFIQNHNCRWLSWTCKIFDELFPFENFMF